MAYAFIQAAVVVKVLHLTVDEARGFGPDPHDARLVGVDEALARRRALLHGRLEHLADLRLARDLDAHAASQRASAGERSEFPYAVLGLMLTADVGLLCCFCRLLECTQGHQSTLRVRVGGVERAAGAQAASFALECPPLPSLDLFT